jgi:probable non-F420 flavinoid oxidoreductase
VPDRQPVRIGFHCSHEQFPPSQLLALARAADAAGFTGGLSSDHIDPWSERQGESGFAWSFLGAALATTRLAFGVVNAPGQRYHPAVVAQAAATLAEMFPERFWIAVGSGQLVNERITGERWPSKGERNARLRECADVMRALWAGETVTHRGLVTVEEARVWSRPATPPLLVAAAVTAPTAEWAAGWADALITVHRERGELQQVVDAWRRGGGEGKPMFLKVQLSYAATDAAARAGAHDQWRNNVFTSGVLTDLRTVTQLDEAGAFVQPEELDAGIRISADPARHVEWLRGDLEQGFSHLYLHNVNREQERFVSDFGERVLPALQDLVRGGPGAA